MGMTTAQKIKALDANATLQKEMKSLTNNIGTNGVCSPMVSTYKALVKQVNAIAKPVGTFKKQIEKVLNDGSGALFGEISSGLDILNAGIGAVNKNLQIDQATLNSMDIFSRVCIDFGNIVPDFLKKQMNALANGVNNFFSSPEGPMSKRFAKLLNSAAEKSKLDAILNGFDEYTNYTLDALEAYRTFIRKSGVTTILNQMEKFEKCMTNPATCNRPKSEFMFPGTSKYNSQYYRELFAIDLDGEVQLSKIQTQVKSSEKGMNRVLKKLDDFKIA